MVNGGGLRAREREKERQSGYMAKDVMDERNECALSKSGIATCAYLWVISIFTALNI